MAPGIQIIRTCPAIFFGISDHKFNGVSFSDKNQKQMLLKIKIENFVPLIVANDRKNFIRHGKAQESAKFYRELYLKLCPLKVIDKESLKLIQVLQLHKAIDHTQSATGSAVLLRSLIQPGTDLHYIRSKQESLSEIASDDKLRRALMDFVHEYGNGENALYKFFNKGLYALFPYPDIKKAKKSAANITRILQTIPVVESPYLKALMSYLHSYENSPIDQMMKARIFKTFNGLKSEQEVGFFTPKLKFTPHRFTEWMLAGPAMALAPLIYDKIGFTQSISPLMSTIGLVWTGIYTFYSLLFKPLRDTERFIEPLRIKCINDNVFNRMVDTVGMIDELLSCHNFAAELPHTAILPGLSDEDRHFFEAVGLKSPVLAKFKTDVVPNDVNMNGTRLTFISGPNSGGKTTLCKSIVHNQLLAQMGSYVLAEKAAINIADRISYQAPKFDGLQDDEGRFGTELSRTRDIFYSTGPKSLVILDELAEGTTYEERLQESFGILSDFYTIGNNTVLVTHNHSLVDRFVEEKKGQCLMAEFDGENPTYRIIPGISRVSHAGRIAEKIHFSKKDRHRYMKENGYF
jgi:DNA mismatch repair protein MutS